MTYSLLLHEQAAKRLAKLDEPFFSAVGQDIQSLRENYFPGGKKCKRLRGEVPDLFRIRIGTYRVMYRVDHDKKIITILRIFSRGEGY